MTTDKLIAELDKALQFPGVANSWTMPIKARIDMLSTGIRTPIGIKVFGKNLDEMETLAKQIEAAAPADIFISADLAWMKDVHDKNLTVATTEKPLLGNEIVLVAPKDSTAALTIAPGFESGPPTTFRTLATSCWAPVRTGWPRHRPPKRSRPRRA